MNKKLIAVVAGIILVIAGAFIYLLLTPKSEPAAQTSPPPPASEDAAPPSEPSKPGVYTEYTAESITTTPGTKLLFFHAPWCPQCREIEADIKSRGVPDGVTVFKVDYDSNQALRQKYGITIQTSFVKVDDQGDKIKSYVAYDEPRFSAVTRELLP